MTSRWMIAGLVALLAGACSKKNDKPAGDTPAPETKQVETAPAPEAARPPAEAKPKSAKLTEERQTMFYADTAETMEFHWMVAGKHVHFASSHAPGENDSVDLKVTATVDGKTSDVFTCAGLDPASGGTVQMKAAGNNAHVICVNPAHSGDPGSSWGAQLVWDAKQGSLAVEGQWEQADDEGDPDSMDIGEDDVE